MISTPVNFSKYDRPEIATSAHQPPRLPQPLRPRIQRLILLGEAEADDVGDGVLRIKGRDGDGGDAGFLHGAEAKGAVVQRYARRGEVDVEKVGALARQDGVAGVGQPRRQPMDLPSPTTRRSSFRHVGTTFAGETGSLGEPR
jgi:hypothetical protein